MKGTGRVWLRAVSLGTLLAASGALGQASPQRPQPPEPRPPHGPRPPAPPQILTLQQSRALVEQATRIVPELRVGNPVRRPQPGARPGAQRPAVPLSYRGAVVAFAFLTPQGRLAELASSSPAPGTVTTDPLPSAAPDLPAQLARLAVSGLVRLTGPHARLSLTLDGRAVAELSFDKQGRPVPVPAGKPVPGGKKQPGPKKP